MEFSIQIASSFENKTKMKTNTCERPLHRLRKKTQTHIYQTQDASFTEHAFMQIIYNLAIVKVL